MPVLDVLVSNPSLYFLFFSSFFSNFKISKDHLQCRTLHIFRQFNKILTTLFSFICHSFAFIRFVGCFFIYYWNAPNWMIEMNCLSVWRNHLMWHTNNTESSWCFHHFCFEIDKRRRELYVISASFSTILVLLSLFFFSSKPFYFDSSICSDPRCKTDLIYRESSPWNELFCLIDKIYFICV